MTEEENWKDIVGYEGLYQISSIGRIKSLKRYKVGKERLKKPSIGRDGYEYIMLWKENKVKRFSVHRLVASAFIENAEHKPEVDHIDTDKTNNNVDNLKWVTRIENQHNPLTAVRVKNQIRHPRSEETKRKIGKRCSVPVFQYTLNMKFVKAYPSAASAARDTGICSELIRKCRRGFYKHAGGYIWTFNKLKEE